MGTLASSQKKSDVWFAPAGFNRGGLSDGAAGIPVVNITERLTSRQRDTLYDNRINPIASFPSSGIVVFGQKTLQERTKSQQLNPSSQNAPLNQSEHSPTKNVALAPRLLRI